MSGFGDGWIPEAYGAPAESSEASRIVGFYSGESLAAFSSGGVTKQSLEPGDAEEVTRPDMQGMPDCDPAEAGGAVGLDRAGHRQQAGGEAVGL